MEIWHINPHVCQMISHAIISRIFIFCALGRFVMKKSARTKQLFAAVPCLQAWRLYNPFTPYLSFFCVGAKLIDMFCITTDPKVRWHCNHFTL